jgi:hypothetical protein
VVAGVAQVVERLSVKQVVIGSIPVTRLVLGCRLTGRTADFEFADRGSNPCIPVAYP